MDRVKPKLEIKGLSKTFTSRKSEFKAVDEVTFDVYDNEFLVILGPGLCGKTVLLNMISGLEEPTEGKTYIDGKEIKGTNRKISMVFQKLGLMPWKTVMENIEIGPKYAGMGKKKRRVVAKKFIDLVKLDGFENSYPRQLSGGMKQRVGIARAYAADPEVLILDEPFGQLDAQTRYDMENEILRMWNAEKKTVIFVTNNIEEAVYLGDRIILLSNCPATVSKIYDIDLPRPRDMMSQEFLKLRAEISNNMELSV